MGLVFLWRGLQEKDGHSSEIQVLMQKIFRMPAPFMSAAALPLRRPLDKGNTQNVFADLILAEPATTLAAARQRCRPIYGEKSADKKYSM